MKEKKLSKNLLVVVEHCGAYVVSVIIARKRKHDIICKLFKSI
jgi:hypothetical protein